MRLKELRAELKTSEKDFERALTPRIRMLMAHSPNVGVGIGSGYAFRCSCCSGIEGRDVYYKLVKERIGPGISGGKTDVSAIKSSRGIVRLQDLGFEPDNSSLVRVTRDGLVCDHCYDSVYSE